MTDLETFIHDDCDGKIFRMYKYKKVWTPYDLDKKFSDESIFENGSYPQYVIIVKAIELPDGDVLLKLLHTEPAYDINEEDKPEENNCYTYAKLSEIVLEEYDIDNERG